MDVRELLEQVEPGSVEIEDVQTRPKNLSHEDLGYAKLDHHRKLRSGFGETVSCQGRPDAYLLETHKKLYERGGEVLGTRALESQAELVRTAIPEVVYDPISRILKVEKPGKECRGCVAVCTGGMADIPVAGEAAQVTEYFGCSADRVFDVEVVGTYRLLIQRERLGKANCIVAVAGMEGALGTTIVGLVEYPAVAVPTSVGYGTSFHGLSALLTMLNSCANGMSVISINNGYGAGYLVAQINKMAARQNGKDSISGV